MVLKSHTIVVGSTCWSTRIKERACDTSTGGTHIGVLLNEVIKSTPNISGGF